MITPDGLRTIVAGPESIVAASASNGRIAVLVSTWPRTVRIYSRTGSLLREIVPSNPREIALTGNQLVVLTSKNTVEVYDWTTGDLLHTWEIAKVPPNALPAHLAVYGRLAVYAIDAGSEAPRTLRLLDLETGQDVAIVRARGGRSSRFRSSRLQRRRLYESRRRARLTRARLRRHIHHDMTTSGSCAGSSSSCRWRSC